MAYAKRFLYLPFNGQRIPIIMKTKICPNCKVEKSLDGFNVAKREKCGRQSYCKVCHNKMTAEFRWKRRGVKCSNHIYNQLFNKQYGCCAICGIHQNDINKKLAVDHNHLTGKVRGLLCSKCNMAIGLLGVDVEGITPLKKSINYIKITSG